ncbi:hypothetical protein QYM36_008191 [Artemia franciscana]|uniref:Uncharacterized protein n=1 Tax=Artemia franciscana TaxID=6661 RepID=A0AA88LMA3_ARTSF|nr:hypothetical protein QYM36_008191 [Artemia franciscana]
MGGLLSETIVLLKRKVPQGSVLVPDMFYFGSHAISINVSEDSGIVFADVFYSWLMARDTSHLKEIAKCMIWILEEWRKDASLIFFFYFYNKGNYIHKEKARRPTMADAEWKSN